MERSSLPHVLKKWVFFGITVSPLLFVGFLLGNLDLKIFLNEFGQFLAGEVDSVQSESMTFSAIPNLIVVGVIAVTIFGTIDDIIAVTIGKPKLVEEMTKFLNMPLILLLVTFAIVSLIEEIVFRGLFLWIMPMAFQSSMALYILVILSSFLFAAMHIFNYRKSGGCLYLVKGIPFFVEALLFAFVFLKFGLLGAFIVHYVHNFIIPFDRRLQGVFIKEKASGLTTQRVSSK